MMLPSFVTTSVKSSSAQKAEAEALASRLGIPFIPRSELQAWDNRKELAVLAGSQYYLAVERDRLVLRALGNSGKADFYFHPGMAVLRIKGLLAGRSDTFGSSLGIRDGDEILDCTLGLGSDAIVASFLAGRDGSVTGLEGSPVIYEIVKLGLANYRTGIPAIDDAMGRIRVVKGRYEDFLAEAPDKSLDIVYFDPMFRLPKQSSSMEAMRPAAIPDMLQNTAVEEAARVARRLVCCKETRDSSEFERLGFKRVVGGRYSEVAYGVRPVMKRLIVIVGPTGVGKSDLAVEVAGSVGGEVVSADSMQVYKLMDIGTAKATPHEMKGVPHHMLNIVWPDQEYTVADYVKQADAVIDDIVGRGKVPIVVGGTGLYIKALLEDYLFPDEGADWDFRGRMAEIARTNGNDALYNRLLEVDPETAARLHPNDIRRVIRALEVYEHSGKPMSAQISSSGSASDRYDALKIGLTADREILYERINLRVDKMIAAGLLDEVKALCEGGYGDALTSMQALGYKEFIPYLKGMTDLDTASELLKRDTRRYAKRQLSWFRRDKEIIWFDRFQYPDLSVLSQKIADLYAGRQNLPAEIKV